MTYLKLNILTNAEYLNDSYRSFTLCVCSDYDCNSSYRSKWFVQDSMEVFTLCDCANITSSYTVHCRQKQIAVANNDP